MAKKSRPYADEIAKGLESVPDESEPEVIAKPVEGNEAAVEAAAAAAPEPVAPESAPSAAATPAEVIDWKKKYEDEQKGWSAREQELKRQNEGILRDLQRTRERRQLAEEAAALVRQQATPQQPQQPSRIPIEWDDKGTAYVKPEVLAQYLPPSREEEIRREIDEARREARQARVIAENPAFVAAESDIAKACSFLDTLVVNAQMQASQAGTPIVIANPDQAVAFIESGEVGKKFRELFPGIAPDLSSMRDLVEFGWNPRVDADVMRRVIKGVAERRAPATPTSLSMGSASPAAPPQMTIPGDRPRPHGERGGAAPAPVGSAEDKELEELNSRDLWTLSNAERRRWTELNRRARMKDRERDAQGRFTS